MYAVIKTGGKQYRVSEGDKLVVEKLTAEAGSDVSIEDVLMVADGDDVTIGTPTVAGASVTAKVVAHDRAAKINIIKFKRRKHYRRQAGHRQHQTHLEITKISKG